MRQSSLCSSTLFLRLGLPFPPNDLLPMRQGVSSKKPPSGERKRA